MENGQLGVAPTGIAFLEKRVDSNRTARCPEKLKSRHRKLKDKRGHHRFEKKKQIEALTAGVQKVSAQLKAADLHRRWSTIPKSRGRSNKAVIHNQPSRFIAWRFFVSRVRLFEIARVPVYLDSFAIGIVNVGHSIM